MTSNTAIARAHPNIAFIKYWGNLNDDLRLPANSSVSMNLDGLFTETRVTWDHNLAADEFSLNGKDVTGVGLERVQRHLNVLRQRLDINLFASVNSQNTFPTGAGIASSASAFAALTVAGVAAAGAVLTERELTTLARMGSGSASRSVPAGFVKWYAANTHEDSYAESIAAPDAWDIVDVIAVVSTEHKAVGSSAGHPSASTSVLQKARVAGADKRLEVVERAIANRDFATFADIVELDSNLMHAVMMTSNPSLFYWQPSSLLLMEQVRSWRREGLNVCYTLDAGPNVHCICVRSDAVEVSERLKSTSVVHQVYVANAGGGAEIISHE